MFLHRALKRGVGATGTVLRTAVAWGSSQGHCQCLLLPVPRRQQAAASQDWKQLETHLLSQLCSVGWFTGAREEAPPKAAYKKVNLAWAELNLGPSFSLRAWHSHQTSPQVTHAKEKGKSYLCFFPSVSEQINFHFPPCSLTGSLLTEILAFQKSLLEENLHLNSAWTANF